MGKKKAKEPDQTQPKIFSFMSNKPTRDISEPEEEETNECNIDLDELLKLPERPEDGAKSMDEEILERQENHAKEMAALDNDIAAERKRREETKVRKKRNALLRDRLEKELTRDEVTVMFRRNLPYLEKVWSGELESSRHKAYHKGIRTRHALYYMMITDPFTDEQLKWTLDEISKVWMRDKKEQMDNNEYVWKVLLPETFIKFYMDHFEVDKVEAEKRISETPLRKQENQIGDSDEDEDW